MKGEISLRHRGGQLNELALFAGAGGGILGGQLLGWRTVCAVEWEPYPASVLCARQNEGLLPHFPIWDDVQTFDGKPWRGIVDVISGGFPCQDISCAGKGAGIEGKRSGMWKEFARIIGEVQPKYVFVENSPMLTSRGLGTVLGDLSEMGFNAEWGVLSAADVGANHRRERIWICARRSELSSHSEHDRYGWGEQQSEGIKETNGKILAYSSNGEHTDSVRGVNAEAIRVPQENWTERSGCGMSGGTSGVVGNGRASRVCNERSVAHTASTGLPKRGQAGQSAINTQTRTGMVSELERCGDVADTNSTQCKGNQCSERVEQKYSNFGSSSWWTTEPNVGRVANGVAARVDRLKAIGNGQVPLCAATAFKLLRERLK